MGFPASNHNPSGSRHRRLHRRRHHRRRRCRRRRRRRSRRPRRRWGGYRPGGRGGPPPPPPPITPHQASFGADFVAGLSKARGVMNGTGILMWTHDDGGAQLVDRRTNQPTRAVHVYGKAWDLAADGSVRSHDSAAVFVVPLQDSGRQAGRFVVGAGAVVVCCLCCDGGVFVSCDHRVCA